MSGCMSTGWSVPATAHPTSDLQAVVLPSITKVREKLAGLSCSLCTWCRYCSNYKEQEKLHHRY